MLGYISIFLTMSPVTDHLFANKVIEPAWSTIAIYQNIYIYICILECVLFDQHTCNPTNEQYVSRFLSVSFASTRGMFWSVPRGSGLPKPRSPYIVSELCLNKHNWYEPSNVSLTRLRGQRSVDYIGGPDQLKKRMYTASIYVPVVKILAYVLNAS